MEPEPRVRDIVVARTRGELRSARAAYAGEGEVAVVMTMGALHAGHAALIRDAREAACLVIVTIFVNPLQFAPGEDLATYPRPFEADLELCRGLGVDLVFAPSEAEMYPTGDALVRVTAGAMGQVLEGVPRPTHFDGVLTGVAKLLHLTRPDRAYFGQKDAQQLALVRRMVADLDLPVDIVAVPIVRDADGLAKSSRNAYLSVSERTSALALSRAGLAAAGSGAGGEVVRAHARAALDTEPGIAVDYCAVVDPTTLVEVGDDHRGDALLLVAARVGTTRLLDNTPLRLGA